jgi:DNA-binding transcriptional regulator YdaS (Cro superfamily)
MTKKQVQDTGLRKAIAAAGSKYRLAQLLGIKPTSVQEWRRVPLQRVIDVERVTGVNRSVLRPEMYR